MGTARGLGMQAATASPSPTSQALPPALQRFLSKKKGLPPNPSSQSQLPRAEYLSAVLAEPTAPTHTTPSDTCDEEGETLAHLLLLNSVQTCYNIMHISV